MPQSDHIVREAHGPEAERPEQGDEQPGGQQALGPQQLRLGNTGRCPADAHRRQRPHHQAEPAHRGRLIFLLLDAERPQQRSAAVRTNPSVEATIKAKRIIITILQVFYFAQTG